MSFDPFILKYITFEFTRLVDPDNKFHDRIRTADALKMALSTGLNLVCFSRPEGNILALCKIIDYGKWKYYDEKNKKKQERQNRQISKEVRFSPVIDDHDIEHKVKQINDFISDGDEIIITMKLKGREIFHFKEAEEKMNKIISQCRGKEISRKKTSNMIIIRLNKENRNGHMEYNKELPQTTNI